MTSTETPDATEPAPELTRRQQHLAKIADLSAQHATAVAGGGQKYRDRHHARGKLLPRERIELLIDEGSAFLELSPLAGWGSQFALGASVVTGIGVVEGRPGGPLRLVAVGVIRTPSTEALHQRLYTISLELEEWLARHDPDAIAVERMFARGDVATIMGTAQASAIPMLAAARRGLPLALHTPSEVKASVTGNGRADKAQVTAMVTRILRLDTPPRPADAADALALAICHVWRGGAAARIDAAVAAQRSR